MHPAHSKADFMHSPCGQVAGGRSSTDKDMPADVNPPCTTVSFALAQSRHSYQDPVSQRDVPPGKQAGKLKGIPNEHMGSGCVSALLLFRLDLRFLCILCLNSLPAVSFSCGKCSWDQGFSSSPHKQTRFLCISGT